MSRLIYVAKMSIFRKNNKFSPFFFLNFSQFCASLNDNLYKYLLLYYLFDLENVKSSPAILALCGAIFVIPFILFSLSSGILADRMSKRNVIVFMKILELVTVSILFVSFILENALLGYIGLFILSTEEAIISPSKYGIVPELVEKDQITEANGYMTSFSYVGIMLGTFFASVLTEITHHDYVKASTALFVIAILGLISALKIPVTPKSGSKKKFDILFFRDIVPTLKAARRIAYLLPCMVGTALFLLVASYSQANIIPYSIYCLGLTDVQGGYFVLITAVGVSIGGIAAGKISGPRVALGLIPLAALGMGLCFFLFDFTVGKIYSTIANALFIGIFGGMFIVPEDSYVQSASPPERRGQNVATTNFLSWCAVLLSAGLYYYMRHVLLITANLGFVILGWISFFAAIIFSYCFTFPMLRLFSFWLAYIGCITLKTAGSIPKEGAALIVVPKWSNAFFLLSHRERVIRIAADFTTFGTMRRWLYRFLHTIPSNQVKEVLDEGHMVVLVTKDVSLSRDLIAYAHEKNIPVRSGEASGSIMIVETIATFSVEPK